MSSITQEAKDALVNAFTNQAKTIEGIYSEHVAVELETAISIVESFPVSDGGKQEMKDEIIKALNTAEERNEHESYEDWTHGFIYAVCIVSGVPIIPNPPTSHK